MTIHRADFGSDHRPGGQQGLGWSGLVGGAGAEPLHHDPVEAYFECITTCSLEDGECVTQCVQILRENG